MSNSPGSEKRQFVRVPVDVQVKYRFIRPAGRSPLAGEVPSGDGSETSGTSQSGTTGNLGAGGLLLVAALPEPDLIADLLMGKVSVGLEMFLPACGPKPYGGRRPEHEPIRAISRVAWLEAMDESSNTCAIGLRFTEITASAQDELFRFVINAVQF